MLRTWLQLSDKPSASRSARSAPTASSRSPCSAWHTVAAVKWAVSRTKRLGWCMDLSQQHVQKQQAGKSQPVSASAFAGTCQPASQPAKRVMFHNMRNWVGPCCHSCPTAGCTSLLKGYTACHAADMGGDKRLSYRYSRSNTSSVMNGADAGPVPSMSCCRAFMLVSRHFQPSLPCRS